MIETTTLTQDKIAFEIPHIPHPKKGKAYAWGKTARILSEDHHEIAQSLTQGDFVAVDLCSSYPTYAQMMRDRHMMDCRSNAKVETGELIQNLESLPTFRRLSREEKRALRLAIQPKNGSLRKFLTSALQQLYYDHPITNSMTDDERVDSIRKYLTADLNNESEVYENVREIPHLEGRGGNWQKLIPVETETTFFDDLEQIAGGDTADLVRDIVQYLIENSVESMRKYSVISVDLKQAHQLRKEADKSFPYEFKNTQFFRDASYFDDHLRTDLNYGVPFGPNSVSLFTSFEGWPFYFSDCTPEQDLEFTKSLATSLKPGGRAVFFPWSFYKEGAKEVARLITLTGYFKRFGLKVMYEERGKSELESRMSDRELVLLRRSPVFDRERGESLTNLILEKPVSPALI